MSKIKDPLYNAIIEALNKPLDGDLFEKCACEILKRRYPTLIPISGGQDAGMDGAGFNEERKPFFLISTTQKSPIGNLNKSLDSHKKQLSKDKRIMFATSQPLSAIMRRNLITAAKKKEYRLVEQNIFCQDFFVEELFRYPLWRKELLGVSGKPSALSLIPKTARPHYRIPMIGRDDDLHWLLNEPGDLIISGQPGCGKTYLLREIAKQGDGLFCVSDELGEIADNIREFQPKIIIIDDVHLKPEFLTEINRLLKDIRVRQDVRIIASCWPHSKDLIMTKRNLTSSSVREIHPLNRDQIKEIIHSLEIRHPINLISILIDASDGKPGLAVTLCDIYIRDGFKDILSGELILRNIKNILAQILSESSTSILACFAFAGSHGMNKLNVAEYLQISLLDIRQITTTLSSAGIIYEIDEEKLSVIPEVLRYALIKNVFFDGPKSLPLDKFLKSNHEIPDSEIAVNLIGVKHRGGNVQDELIKQYVTRSDSSNVWLNYSRLGEEECKYVLDNYPDKYDNIESSVLRYYPILAITRILNEQSEFIKGNLSSNRNPFSRLQSWVKKPYPGTLDATQNRKHLLKVLIKWFRNGGDHSICLSYLGLVFDPKFQRTDIDPGTGLSLIMNQSVLNQNELFEIKALWIEALEIIEKLEPDKWQDLQTIIWAWASPQDGLSSISNEVLAMMRSFSKDILVDLSNFKNKGNAYRHTIESTALSFGIGIKMGIDEVFKTIYPIEKSPDLPYDKKQQQDVVSLATKLSRNKPKDVIDKLIALELESNKLPHKWPDYFACLIEELALNVESPSDWANYILQEKTGSEFIIFPFLHQSAKHTLPTENKLIKRCLKRPKTKSAALLVILLMGTTDQELIDLLIKNISYDPRVILSAHREVIIPVRIMKQCLTHKDDNVRSSAVTAEWLYQGHRNVRKTLRRVWVKAFLKNYEDKTCLHDIVTYDSEIAFLWLLKQVKENGFDLQ